MRGRGKDRTSRPATSPRRNRTIPWRSSLRLRRSDNGTSLAEEVSPGRGLVTSIKHCSFRNGAPEAGQAAGPATVDCTPNHPSVPGGAPLRVRFVVTRTPFTEKLRTLPAVTETSPELSPSGAARASLQPRGVRLGVDGYAAGHNRTLPQQLQ